MVGDMSSESLPLEARALQLIRRARPHVESLRAFQVDALSHIISGKRDLVLQYPTGSGKTFSFLLAPMLTDSVMMVVVCPLVVVASNHETVWQNMGLEGMVAVHGGITATSRKLVATANFRLLLCTPEALFDGGDLFRRMMQSADDERELFVIFDEFHLIYNHGSGPKPFRDACIKACLDIRSVRRRCRIGIVSATLTPDMIKWAQKHMGFRADAFVLAAPCMRTNVSIDVTRDIYKGGVGKVAACLRMYRILTRLKGRVLIFTDQESIGIMASMISVHNLDKRAGQPYMHHEVYVAETPPTDKIVLHNTFTRPVPGRKRRDLNVILATEACSAGIDIPDIRTVVLMPPDMRDPAKVAQMIGRAGRDGMHSTAILAYRAAHGGVATHSLSLQEALYHGSRKCRSLGLSQCFLSPVTTPHDAAPYFCHSRGSAMCDFCAQHDGKWTDYSKFTDRSDPVFGSWEAKSKRGAPKKLRLPTLIHDDAWTDQRRAQDHVRDTLSYESLLQFDSDCGNLLGEVDSLLALCRQDHSRGTE